MKVNELFKSIPNSSNIARWKRMVERLNDLTMQKTLDKSKDAGSPLEVEIHTLEWVVDMPFKYIGWHVFLYTGTVNEQKRPHGFGRAIRVETGTIYEG